MKRENIPFNVTPPELRQPEELLIRYGLWAQDRYKKRRCASAEGRYRIPANREDRLQIAEMGQDHAMEIDRALRVVPEQFRRVLKAEYVERTKSAHATRRILRIGRDTWDFSRVQGLRIFWGHYLRRLTK
jgi:hypothetical protein